MTRLARLWAARLLLAIADRIAGLARRLVTVPAQEPEKPPAVC